MTNDAHPLSTKEMGWLLGQSPSAIRRMIRDGDIEGVRIPGGFRIPRAEARRLSRERIEAEAGRKVSDSQLDRLIAEVITTNEARTS
jgi:excisionase family DNA binding protein